MACSSRISQVISRSITTGDFYTGLKYLKINQAPIEPSTSTRSEPTTPLVTASTSKTGCRTISRQTAKKVAIPGGPVPIRKGATASTITPNIKNVIHDRPIPTTTINASGAHAGAGSHRAGSSYAWFADRPRGNSRAATNPSDGDGKHPSEPPKQPPSEPGGGGGSTPVVPAGGKDSAGTTGTTGAIPLSGAAAPPASSGRGGPPEGASTSGTGTTMVRPPIRMPGISGAYAGALYSAASKNNKLEVVEQDMIKIRDQFNNDPKLRNFLLAPDVPIPLKLEGVEAFKKLNIDVLSFNLLKIMAENRRFKILLVTIAAYLEIMSAYKGIVDCTIISARAMKPEQKNKLTQILGNFLPGKTANTVERIDPTLIGGFILLVGQQHINLSMQQKLNNYEALIRQPA